MSMLEIFLQNVSQISTMLSSYFLDTLIHAFTFTEFLFFDFTSTVRPWREGKGECVAAGCKGAGDQAGVGFDPVPLRATHFRCMTECQEAGATGFWLSRKA